MLDHLGEMQVLIDKAKEVKEKKVTPLTKLESVTKICVTLENMDGDHLSKLLRSSSRIPLSYISFMKTIFHSWQHSNRMMSLR